MAGEHRARRSSESVLGFRYNVCILAYGQTGCGKSYTMLGPHSEEERVPARGPHSDLGILPRAAGELFRYLGQGAREAAAPRRDTAERPHSQRPHLTLLPEHTMVRCLNTQSLGTTNTRNSYGTFMLKFCRQDKTF